METGVATVSVRLLTTYGPGRDKGFTSAPTTALKAAALNCAYAVPYQGREHYHYVHDVAAGFAGCAMDPFSGYDVFNLRGESVENAEFVEMICRQAEALGLGSPAVTIAEDAQRLPFVCDLDEDGILAAFPNMPRTSLEQGVTESLKTFKAMADSGELTAADIQ